MSRDQNKTLDRVREDTQRELREAQNELNQLNTRKSNLGQGKEALDKWVCYFDGTDKGLVLNKTNLNTIARLYGDDTDLWIGKPITLFATEVQFGSTAAS